MRALPSRQAGFGYIAAILVLVVLAVLAAALVKTSTTQQTTAALDILAARAQLAARTGTEWGLHRALRGAAPDCAGPKTLNLDAGGFNVTVTCTRTVFFEGLDDATGIPVQKAVYAIDAVACNSANCPDNARAASPDYVESRRIATACATIAPVMGNACYN